MRQYAHPNLVIGGSDGCCAATDSNAASDFGCHPRVVIVGQSAEQMRSIQEAGKQHPYDKQHYSPFRCADEVYGHSSATDGAKRRPVVSVPTAQLVNPTQISDGASPGCLASEGWRASEVPPDGARRSGVLPYRILQLILGLRSHGPTPAKPD